MTLQLSFKEFRVLLLTAVELDRVWPRLHQVDFYCNHAAIGQHGVTLILP